MSCDNRLPSELVHPKTQSSFSHVFFSAAVFNVRSARKSVHNINVSRVLVFRIYFGLLQIRHFFGKSNSLDGLLTLLLTGSDWELVHSEEPDSFSFLIRSRVFFMVKMNRHFLWYHMSGTISGSTSSSILKTGTKFMMRAALTKVFHEGKESSLLKFLTLLLQWIIHSTYFFFFLFYSKEIRNNVWKNKLENISKTSLEIPSNSLLSCGYSSKDLMENAANTVIMFLVVLRVL